MHRLKSTSTIYRFRFAALLLCAKYVLFVIVGVFMIHAMIDSDPELVLVGVDLIGLTVLVAILQCRRRQSN